MELISSLPCLQEPTTCPFAEPDDFSLQYPTLNCKIYFNIDPLIYACVFSMASFLSFPLHYPVCVSLRPICATFAAYLILPDVILVGTKKVWRSSYNLIQSSNTYWLLGPSTVASSASCSETPSAYVLLFIGEMSYCRTMVAMLGKQNGVQAQGYSVFCYQFAACSCKSPSTRAHLIFVLPVITRTQCFFFFKKNV